MVLALAGYGRCTLWKRIRNREMPSAVDRGAHGGIWLRDEVLKALKLTDGAPPKANPADAWNFNADAYRKACEDDARRRGLKRKINII
jgi:predicted DNA-binding transcriptional regulator AlpA